MDTIANLGGTFNHRTHLEGARLAGAHFEDANLQYAHLERSGLIGAHLSRADLRRAHLEQGTLADADLQGAILVKCRLQGVDLTRANLAGSDASGAFFNEATDFVDTVLSSAQMGCARLVDVRWGGANLAVINWSRVRTLGDELEKSDPIPHGRRQREFAKLEQVEAAVRANRQLAEVLRNQGLTEQADRFAYRARQLHRRALRREAFIWSPKRQVSMIHRLRDLGTLAGSLMLDMSTGYGYRPSRSLLAYLAVVMVFADIYFLAGPAAQVPLSPVGALVFSITSFHGRGFFPGGTPGHSITLDDALPIVASVEAFVGLVIEISFIATFTHRFFSR